MTRHTTAKSPQKRSFEETMRLLTRSAARMPAMRQSPMHIQTSVPTSEKLRGRRGKRSPAERRSEGMKGSARAASLNQLASESSSVASAVSVKENQTRLKMK